MTSCFLCAWIGVLLAQPPLERASFGAVELRWRAPAGCPSVAELERRIRADLATTPDGRDPLSILIDDEVTATDDGRFALVSRTTSATGSESRRWVADACATLGEIAAAQTLSAIDQSLAEQLPPLDPNAARAPEPAPAPPPAPPPQLEPRPAPRPPTAPRRRVHVALRPSLGAEIGGLPRAGVATGLDLALLTRRVRAELATRYFTPRTTGGREGAVLQLLTAAVRVCPRVVLPRLELAAPCVGLELGAAVGRGVGVAKPRRDTVLWAAAAVGPVLAVRVHPRIAVVADAHAAFPLGRPRFSLRERGTVWRASTGARVLAGLEVRLR